MLFRSLREARRKLRPYRHAHRKAGRRRTGHSRGVQKTQGPSGVPGFHHRPGRERLAHGQGRPRTDRNAAGLGRSIRITTMKHVISILLENEPGALSRVVGLFSARGYNIETLTVAPTEADRKSTRLNS